MPTKAFTKPKLIKTESFPVDPDFKLRIARADEDEALRKALDAGHFEAQLTGGYTLHWCQLSLVGSHKDPRPVASLLVDLRQFEEVVRYDPARAESDKYFAQKMLAYHEKTQADFQGAKKRNLVDYAVYGLEALRGERKANLPEINGWCDVETSEETLFVALHEPEKGLLYGRLLLPKANPVMQADGQTQTAMLFRLADSKLGATQKEDFRVKLEIEFGLTPENAGQAFADRNGRGVKKNRNLVADLTVVGGLATIMKEAVKGTIFEKRIYNGRNQSISESSTTNIMDLATLEQVVLNACTYGAAKPEHIKDIHVKSFLPVARDFLQMLEKLFGAQWPSETQSGGDSYRKIYVHGWSFAFKALARAYYRTRVDELGPLSDAMQPDDPDELKADTEAAWKKRARKLEEEDEAKPVKERKYVPKLKPRTLESRLRKIDWVRHRKHWVDITGFTRSAETGNPNTKTLADGTRVIKSKAPTQQEVISGIEGTILGPEWTKLQSKRNFDWKRAS